MMSACVWNVHWDLLGRDILLQKKIVQLHIMSERKNIDFFSFEIYSIQFDPVTFNALLPKCCSHHYTHTSGIAFDDNYYHHQFFLAKRKIDKKNVKKIVKGYTWNSGFTHHWMFFSKIFSFSKIHSNQIHLNSNNLKNCYWQNGDSNDGDEKQLTNWKSDFSHRNCYIDSNVSMFDINEYSTMNSVRCNWT